MKRFVGFEHGMGLGGWLTNYKRFNVLPSDKQFDITIGDMEHFAQYITERDIEYIASLGMDHIRLGFDQIVLEQSPYVYREQIFEYIDSFIMRCKKHGLNVVLNLHKALGNYCDIKANVGLLDDDDLQNRFIALWLKIEQRYSYNNSIAFELLNEVLKVPPQKWNALAKKTVSAIRKINKTRKIIIGSVCWNSVNTLKDLQIFDDENVIYTFHFYEPFEFTHQKSVLQELTMYYNRTMPYPGDIERYRNYKRTVLGDDNAYSGFERMEINVIRDLLRPAAEFISQHPDKALWCGEFGTIRHANINWRENWMRDVITVLREYDIPYCVWNYLSTPNDGNRFSLVDDESRIILSENMAKIIKGEV